MEGIFVCQRCGKEIDVVYYTPTGLCEFCYDDVYGKEVSGEYE